MTSILITRYTLNTMEDKNVRSVDLVLAILENLADKGEMGVTEIAKTVNIHKSTVYRFINALMKAGYVYQNQENEKYSLTFRILEIGSKVMKKYDVKDIADPIMQELSEKTKETIHLGVLEHYDVIHIAKIDSTQYLRIHTWVGQRFPAYACGLGKVLLSFGPVERVNALLESGPLQKYTDTTITDPLQLLQELDEIRKNGYAFDRQELVPGICCIAAPIYDHTGSVKTAMSITMPSLRFKEARIPYLRDLILESARNVSLNLGCDFKSEKK